jgi:hypothetical protein
MANISFITATKKEANCNINYSAYTRLQPSFDVNETRCGSGSTHCSGEIQPWTRFQHISRAGIVLRVGKNLENLGPLMYLNCT